MRPLRVGGCFAGYGGLELSVRRLFPSAEPAWFSEFDAAPSRILAHHWPSVPNLGDITLVDWSRVEPVDIMTGGSPCQDLSHAGKRAGMQSGTRSGLWESMREGIAVLRPSLVIWENVRGALSARAASDVEREPGRLGNGKRRPALRALGRVLGDLASLRYDAVWVGLRAADVGAPHGRFRIFVVAWPSEDPSALSWPSEDPSALLPTPAVNDMGAAYTPDEWDEWTARMKAAHANGNGHGASLHIEALRMLPTPRVSDANGAGSHGEGGDDLRTAVSLLPTPRATRGGSGTETMYGLGGERSDDDRTQGRVLLPTPTAMDSRASGGNPDTTGTHETTLTDALVRNPRRNDADATVADTRQDLSGVRVDVQPEALQRGSREQPALPLEGLLLTELREHEGVGDEGCAALAGAEASSPGVRRVRNSRPSTRAPQRPEPREQRPGEPDDPLCVVPPAAALAGGPGATDGRSREGHSDSASAWGIYAPAVARWEMVLGRPAPSPTEPSGRDGEHRLSARAVEFMMGLPDGWVTDVPGVARNDALKALGNGVVPQQAAEGIAWCLEQARREAVA